MEDANKTEMENSGIPIPVEPDGSGNVENVEGQPTDQGQPNAEPKQSESFDYLETKTFGTGEEGIKKQAQAYKPAVKKMHEATAKAAKLERENEELKQKLEYSTDDKTNNTGQSFNEEPNIKNLTPQQRESLESEYGLPAEQVLGLAKIISKITEKQQEPLLDLTVSQQVSSLKNTLKSTDKDFEVYEESFDKQLKKYPAKNRLNPEVIRECIKTAKGESFEAILNKRLEEYKTNNTDAEPQNVPIITKPNNTNSGKNVAKKSILDSEQVKNLKLQGYSDEEIQQFESQNK